MKILIFFMIFSTNSIFSNEWQKKEVEDVGIAKKIICIDSNLCFLFSDSNVYKTTDKGNSWTFIESITQLTSRDFSCPNKNNLYIGLRDGIVRYSNNGGNVFENNKIEEVNLFDNILMIDSLKGVLSNVYMKEPLYYILVTEDNWKTFSKFNPLPEDELLNEKLIFSYRKLEKLNDSIVYTFCDFRDMKDLKNVKRLGDYLLKLNINDFSYELIDFNHRLTIQDFDILNDSIFIISGISRSISGGTGHDAVFKSTDSGKSWRQVLDFRPTDVKMPGVNYWGLQKIAFKNDSIGIAVGQFGKIVYTYDGGESWIYETKLPPYLGGGESNPPTMVIEYAGDTPIIGAFNGTIHIMTEDTYAPKPEDTLTISGRVSLDGVGLEGIAISLNTYRITMTDENGYYRFRKLPTGNHIVKAINKYVDYGPNIENFYTPFLFSSEYDLDLTGDTTEIDFVATDNRNFYSLSGSVTLDNKGLEDIVMQFGSNTVTTNEDGYFIFDSVEQWRHNLTPITEGYTYEPEFYDITLNEHFTSMNFVASPITSVKSNPNFEFKNNILYSKEIVGLKYRLIDLQGRVIKKNNLSSTIDFSYLDNGTYILQITKNNIEVFSEKFQVVR